MSEFKMIISEKAKIYLKNSLSKELQDTMYPMCIKTCAEICVEDYTSGYNQCLEDSKAPELLELLTDLVNNDVIKDSNLNNQAKQLIKEST